LFTPSGEQTIFYVKNGVVIRFVAEQVNSITSLLKQAGFRFVPVKIVAKFKSCPKWYLV
jgi:hypothetical protein